MLSRPNVLAAVAVAVLAATACTTSTPPAPSAKPTAAPAAKPVDEPKPAAAKAEPSEWDRVLTAARQEGKVAIIGPGGDQVRDAVVKPFEDKYGITVEFLGGSGRELSPRVLSERAAGQYNWDILMHGTTTGLDTMVPAKALDPIEPSLILPEVKDLKNWRGGEIEYLAPNREILVMTPFQRGTLFVNPSLVKPEDIKSYKDLLDPKWRGKIVIDDPRASGPGQATFTFFYLHPDLGPEFIRALGKQELVILKDYRQELDAVGQGRYPILIGTADFAAEPLIQQGVPIVIVDPRNLKEGADTSPANGVVALFNRAPHPNAAKVFINWLLSKEGQTAFARSTGYVSGRLDVPTDHTFPWRVPQPGAIKTYDEKALGIKDQVVNLLKDVLGAS